MDVSVIVPCYNAAPFLERCLESLLAQDYPENRYEVLLIDNNSTDSSAAIASRYPRVILLREARQGAYAARNCGLGAARGQLIAFTDPDCEAHRDWLRRLVAAMDDAEALVVMGRDRPAGQSHAVRLLGAYDHIKESFVLTSRDPTVYYAHTNNMIVRRQLFERFGPFDEVARGGDVLFVQRVLQACGTDAVRYHPEALVEHLEVATASVYLRKAFLYGGSGYHYGKQVEARPLSNRERLQVLRRTVREERLRPGETLLLAALLGAGVLWWYAGRWLAAARSAGPKAAVVSAEAAP